MEIHWYELVYRGISPGCFPRDSIATEHNHINYKGKNFGAVAYNRELTEKEVADYELNKVGKVRELYELEKWSEGGRK